MNRRKFIASVASVVTVGLAGCQESANKNCRGECGAIEEWSYSYAGGKFKDSELTISIVPKETPLSVNIVSKHNGKIQYAGTIEVTGPRTVHRKGGDEPDEITIEVKRLGS